MEETSLQVKHDLIEVLGFVKYCIQFADSGSQLASIAQAWMAIDELMEYMELSEAYYSKIDLGFEEGDSDYREGLFVGLDISDEGVLLSRMTKEYSRDWGSDHNLEVCARFDGAEGFESFGLQEWLNAVSEVRGQSNLLFSAE